MIKKSLVAVYNYLDLQTRDASHQITLFGLVMMINYPLFGVFWKIEHIQVNEEFSLRIIATVLCALLALNTFWPKSLLKYLPVFWYVVLLVCLPYFFCYLTLIHHGSTVWLMNCVSAIFFLLLVTSVLGALSLLFLGVGLSFFCYYYLSNNVLQYIPGHISLFSLTITYTAAIVIGALFARDREITHAGRLLGMKMMAGSIAHDLRTPLASIHLQAELQSTILNKLNNSEVQKDLRENLIKINRSIEVSNQLINMQLHNIEQNKVDTNKFTIHSIANLLNHALSNYPLKENQTERVELNAEPDFFIWIEKTAFKNLVWNLLKNCLDFIDESGRGRRINIWLELGSEQDNFNYLHMKDTTKSLCPTSINKLRDSLSSDRLEGAGPGLSYCNQLMQSAGGDIICKGKVNEEANYTLKFPKVD
jgi:signal transduction histidine kinase